MHYIATGMDDLPESVQDIIIDVSDPIHRNGIKNTLYAVAREINKRNTLFPEPITKKCSKSPSVHLSWNRNLLCATAVFTSTGIALTITDEKPRTLETFLFITGHESMFVDTLISYKIIA